MRAEPIVERWRGVALILACFAVALRIALPAGFMPSSVPGAGLVICDGGAGALRGDIDPAQESKRVQPGACVFAVPATAPAPSAGDPPLEPLVFVPARVAAGDAWDLLPGRGLAAPPPPPRGPPPL